jgi:sugar phosphate isomerase/epimerase
MDASQNPAEGGRRVSVSGICTNQLTLQEDLAFWDRHGIVDVGIPLRKLGDGGAEQVAAAGVRVSNLLGWGPRLDDRSSWPEYLERIDSAFEQAITMGAECLVVTTGPAGSLDWERAARSWSDLAEEVFVGAPVRVLLEHTNQLRHDIGFVHTLRDAADLVRPLGLGLVVEVNACWMERGLAHTLSDAADLIGLVQVSDTMPGTRCTPDRAVPGDGMIPLGRVLGEILAAGYRGAFDLEMIGPRIEAEGYEKAVPRALAALRVLLDGIDLRRAESGHR